MQKKRIVVLGGGTGTFTALSGLKYHPVDLSAVVSIADNGGSTGVLRDELGVLPPGDIRQCLVALASGDDILRRLFTYRFHEGSLSGHTFGNLFLSALEKVTGDPLSAVREAHRILQVRGQVIPASATASTLYAELEDGTVVAGEHAIDEPTGGRAKIRRCFLSPNVAANQEALTAIAQADAIVLGPGDLYTSLIPVLQVDDIAQAVASSKARRIFIVPLATKRGQTDGYTASRFVRTLERELGGARIDRAIVNSATPSAQIAERYAQAGEPLVMNDLRDNDELVLLAPLLADEITETNQGDTLKRSLLRHDPDRLAAAILTALA